jgi:carboxyl-terminal processing protease
MEGKPPMAQIRRPAGRYLLLAIAGLLLVGGASATSPSKNVFKSIRTYQHVLANVYDKYVEELDSQDLIHASIDGMMKSLDPHSAFLEKKQYDDLLLETQGKYGGVGIQIDIRDEWLTVVAPIEGTPAYKLGLRAGDRIVAIEGKTTKGITTADAAKVLRGPKGTKVTITIARKGEIQPWDVTIERDVVELKSVPYRGIVRDGIGYLRLSRFSEDTGREVEEGLRALVEQGAKGIVFDLRTNHGGLLTQAVSVANKFLERGKLISYTQGRHPEDRSEYFATENPVLPGGIPVAVLVNGSTASASEIVSGALQDDGRAVILGELTYGKGLVQTLIPLEADVSLKLTTAKWYTPAGRCIQKPFDQEQEDEEALGDELAPPHADEPAPGEAGTAPDGAGEETGEGGIQPDIVLEGDTVSRYEAELVSANHFFRFAVNWTADHKNIPRGWRASEAVIEEFRGYLREQEFDYETVAEVELGHLRELSKSEEFDAATLTALDTLGGRLDAEKARDFDRYHDEIAYWLEREVMYQLHGMEGLYETMLRSDNQVQAAIELLRDPAAYAKALRGKEPIAAAAPAGKG